LFGPAFSAHAIWSVIDENGKWKILQPCFPSSSAFRAFLLPCSIISPHVYQHLRPSIQAPVSNNALSVTVLSPVSIQTQSLALRALRKRKPQETQELALASSQSWLLRPSIPIGWRLRFFGENFTQQT